MTFPRRLLLWVFALLLAAWALRAPFLHREIWNIDEGVTFTLAEQIRHGAVLYRDAADHRSPLVPYLQAALFTFTGDWNLFAQHLALALAMGTCAFSLLLLTRAPQPSTSPSLASSSLAGPATAVAFTFIVLLLPGPADALGLHTESFVLFFSTLGFTLFAFALPRGGFLAGLPIGLAFSASALCKQPGLLDFVVTAPILAFLAWRQPADRSRLVRLFLGALTGFAALFLLTCLYFAVHGAWRDFVYYAWTYNTRLYVPEISLAERLATFRLTWDFAWRHLPAAAVLALPGLLLALRSVALALRDRTRPTPVLPLLILGWLCSSVLASTLGGRGFGHYTLQSAPALALAAGFTLASLAPFFSRTTAHRLAFSALLLALIAWAGLDVRRLHAQLRPTEDPSDLALRTVVQHYSAPDDRLFIWGYFPEGYVYTRRLPATRFVYTNFLTGLIPWTNLDPQTDTRYAIVPGAWDAFWRDYTSTPPAIIVDATLRGYGKYPLLAQPRLRDELIDHFAELRPIDLTTHVGTIHRRLAPPDPAFASSNDIPIDPALRPQLSRHPDHSDLAILSFTPPPDATHLTIRLAGQPHRHLVLRPGLPVETRFLLRPSDLTTSSSLDLVLRRNSTLTASPPLDPTASNLTRPTPGRGPDLVLAPDRILAPIESSALADDHLPSRLESGWFAHAPARLVYEIPTDLHAVTIGFELPPHAWADEHGARRSDGITALAEFVSADGSVTPLYQRTIDPFANPTDRGPITARLQLPRRPGRLIIRLTNGPAGNGAYDWSTFPAQFTGELSAPATPP